MNYKEIEKCYKNYLIVARGKRARDISAFEERMISVALRYTEEELRMALVIRSAYERMKFKRDKKNAGIPEDSLS